MSATIKETKIGDVLNLSIRKELGAVQIETEKNKEYLETAPRKVRKVQGIVTHVYPYMVRVYIKEVDHYEYLSIGDLVMSGYEMHNCQPRGREVGRWNL